MPFLVGLNTYICYGYYSFWVVVSFATNSLVC